MAAHPPPDRPYLFNAKLAKAFIRDVRDGAYLGTAAAAAGISRKTLHDWLRNGARDAKGGKSTDLAKFHRAVRAAQAKSEMDHVRIIKRAARRGWAPAAWMLSRKYPDRWGQKDRTDDKEIDRLVAERLQEMLSHAETEARRRQAEIDGAQQRALPPAPKKDETT